MSTAKEKILEAAGALFSEGGVAALNVRDIAERAGLSTIGIYSHFKGKQGILDALYIEGFELIAQTMRTVPESLSAHRAILRAGMNYLNTAIEYQAHYNLIYGPMDGSYTPSATAREVAASSLTELTRFVARRLPPGTSPDDQQAFALQIWAYLHGSVSLRHHSVAHLVDMSQWRERTIKTLDAMLSSLSEIFMSKSDEESIR